MQTDFAQIANLTEESADQNYKYNYSYEEIVEQMRKHISEYQIEIEKYFSLIVFNYLVGDGDSHLKNIFIIRNEKYGDCTLTPAYDLANTYLLIKNNIILHLKYF